MKNFKSGVAVLVFAASIAGGVSALAGTARAGDASADAKAAIAKLQFMAGRFALKPYKSKADAPVTPGLIVENTINADGTSLRQIVHNGGAPSGEKIVTYDPEKHLYHMKVTDEGQDASPEYVGQFVKDALVLEQVNPANGSTGLAPRVHDGVIDVVKVFPGLSAEKAGLRKGDVITKIEGKSLAGVDRPNLLLMGPPDTDVVVTVRRKGSEHDYTIRRKGVAMVYRKTYTPMNGGGYRQLTVRTDVRGALGSGSDAVPVGR